MSAVQEAAHNFWNELVKAMRADGLIAECIIQAGGATTHLIMTTCAAIHDLNAKPLAMPWLPENFRPTSGRVVLVEDDAKCFRCGHWNDNTQLWRSAETGDELTVVRWKYIDGEHQ